MMVGGSFLVSMANSSSPDAQASGSENTGEVQSESGDQDAPANNNSSGSLPVNDSDNNAESGKNSTGNDETDETAAEVKDNVDNEVKEDIDSDGANEESNGSDTSSPENTQIHHDGDNSSLGNMNVQSQESEVTDQVNEAGVSTAPENPVENGAEPPAPKENSSSEEAPEIDQTVDREEQNEDGTVTIIYKEGIGHPHDTKKQEYHKDPTCEEEGYNIVDIHCKNHKDLVIQRTIETIPALGHNMGEWEVVKEASLSEDGLVERHCLREGCDHTESDILRTFVIEPDPIKEETAISYIYEEPSGDIGEPAAHSESSQSSSGSYGGSGGVYTSSVSPALPIIIESENVADANVIEDTPSPEIISPDAELGNSDISEDASPLSHLILAIDLLLSISLIAGLGVLWKLGLLKV